MGSACVQSATYSSSYGGKTYNVTGSVYVDYLYHDYPEYVTVTSRILLSLSTSQSGTGSATIHYPEPYIEMHDTPYWYMLSYAYSGYMNNSMHYVDISNTIYKVCSDLPAFTINKTYNPQNLSVTARYGWVKVGFDADHISGNRYFGNTTVTEALPQIPAKDHYSVTYYANGGTGAPNAGTKWYNETFYVTTDKPTRTGFTFKGWATSSTGAVAYNSGASYTTNAALNLYAVWERNSYAVTYNANGGTNPPANQTKYYGIDLKLSNNVPTFTGYTFRGWATSTARAGAGNVDYARGATYQGNAALNLYAVWELTYHAPVIKNVSIERCEQGGQPKDDGDCALVTFDWSIFRSSLSRYYGGSNAPYASNSIANDGCVVTVGTYTAYRTPTGVSDTNYPVVVGSAFNPDQAYNATISITDDTNHTTTVTGTLPSQYFPMDFNADATAVGFFMPAPNDNEGAHFGKDVHISIDINTMTEPDNTIYQTLVKLGWTDVLE